MRKILALLFCIPVAALAESNISILLPFDGAKGSVRSFSATGSALGMFSPGSDLPLMAGSFSGPFRAEVAFVNPAPNGRARFQVLSANGKTVAGVNLPIPLAKIHAISAADYSNDGITDLLITRPNGKGVLFVNPGTSRRRQQKLSLPRHQTHGMVLGASGERIIAAILPQGNRVSIFTPSGSRRGSFSTAQKIDTVLPIVGPGEPRMVALSGQLVSVLDGSSGATLESFEIDVGAAVLTGRFSSSAIPFSDLLLIFPEGTTRAVSAITGEIAVNSLTLTQQEPPGQCPRDRLATLQRNSLRALQNGQFNLYAQFELQIAEILARPECQVPAEVITYGVRALNRSLLVRGGFGLFCDRERPRQDGPGGFLAKGFSDNDGRLVVLYPGNERPVKTEILNPDNFALMETLTFSALANPDNLGLRSHFRGTRSGPSTGLGGRYIIRATQPDGQRDCFRIDMSGGINRFD